MKQRLIMLAIICLGLAFWAYKGALSYQAFQLAADELTSHPAIRRELGAYTVHYDWWFGAFRALRYGKIQEFEFHLSGARNDAVAVVNLSRQTDWVITCINVVNGDYLNNRIIHDC